MQAGRGLDALIAEKIFGWKYVGNSRQIGRGLVGYNPAREMEIEDVPNYSTDITSAWEVVDKVSSGYREFFLEKRLMLAFVTVIFLLPNSCSPQAQRLEI